MRNTLNKLIEAIQKRINSEVEYETTHKDAGDNYYLLLTEGNMHDNDIKKRLRDYILYHDMLSEHVLDTNIDTIINDVIEALEATSTTLYHCTDIENDTFTYDSFEVGELEIQIEIDDYDLTDIGTPNTRRALIRYLAERDHTFYLNYNTDSNVVLAYEGTDAAWAFTITKDDLEKICETYTPDLKPSDNPTFTASIGSISKGTQRPEDLIDSFIDMLDELMNNRSLHSNGIEFKEDYRRLTQIISEIETRISTQPNYYNTEGCNDDIETLTDALNEFSPVYCYFGAHEGNAADLGFWPSSARIDDDIHDNDLTPISDLAEIKEPGSYLLTNDHGNQSLICVNNDFTYYTAWDCI